MTVEGNTLSWTADLRPGETAEVRVFAADVEGNQGTRASAWMWRPTHRRRWL